MARHALNELARHGAPDSTRTAGDLEPGAHSLPAAGPGDSTRPRPPVRVVLPDLGPRPAGEIAVEVLAEIFNNRAAAIAAAGAADVAGEDLARRQPATPPAGPASGPAGRDRGGRPDPAVPPAWTAPGSRGAGNGGEDA